MVGSGIDPLVGPMVGPGVDPMVGPMMGPGFIPWLVLCWDLWLVL